MSRRHAPPAVSEALGRSRFLLLLSCLMLLFAVQPLLGMREREIIGRDVALAVVLLAGVWSVSHSRLLIGIGLSLVLPTIVAAWLASIGTGPAIPLVGLSFALAFLVFMIVTLLALVLRSRAVTTDTILGGI